MLPLGETEYSTHGVSFSMISHNCLCIYDYLHKNANKEKEYVDLPTKIMFWGCSNKIPASSKTEKSLCPTVLESEGHSGGFLVATVPTLFDTAGQS